MRRVPTVSRALRAGYAASARPRRVPARRPGNFHLLAQMKVTKAKGLNTHLCGEDGDITDALFEAPWISAGCLLDPSSLRDFIGRKSPGSQRFDLGAWRPQVAGFARSREQSGTGVDQLAAHAPIRVARPVGQSETVSARSRVHQVDRSPSEPPEREAAQAASHAKRNRFSRLGRRKSGALTQQMFGQMCIQALCFGDFHLCQQMKVTRPPGRDPATHKVNCPAEGDSSTRPPGRDPAPMRYAYA
jgi:hypothetical protein